MRIFFWIFSFPSCALSTYLRSSSEHAPHQESLDVVFDRLTSGRIPPAVQPLNLPQEVHDALEAMQSHFYELWMGTWPSAIDWTAAVLNTYISTTLSTFSRILQAREFDLVDTHHLEVAIEKYYQQSIAFFFVENAFSLRNQAYDDMLWVVLGWLESVKFVDGFRDMHNVHQPHGIPWHGAQFKPAFAHRAHVFYDIASRGWDSSLCGGGLTWNPHLALYKNAITNQLFISASVGMYLYFPRDTNGSPYLAAGADTHDLPYAEPHDPAFLKSAVKGYAWLKDSNMTNKLGLYVDGFHITNWSRWNHTGTGKCDSRNEMVYTYNQGVILSGLRDLWEATGDVHYLTDGHELVRNVINATGWAKAKATGAADKDGLWAGLGRNGILEELCDETGYCNQDGQIFKGIFFQHLTLFCKSLPREQLIPGKTYVATKKLAARHSRDCHGYGVWVMHNAKAAMTTRNVKGLFGMWWNEAGKDQNSSVSLPVGAVDYRNDPTELETTRWLGSSNPTALRKGEGWSSSRNGRRSSNGTDDMNERGRGRTVETQSGGLAVLRAAWELRKIHS